jgi:hypothetical protein
MNNFEEYFNNKYPWYNELLNQYMNLFYVYIDYNLSDKDLYEVFVDKINRIEENKKIYIEKISNIEKNHNLNELRTNLSNKINYLESVDINNDNIPILKKEYEKFNELYHYKSR